ncbi:TIGR03084 family metal-binding protein [Dactylosporangium sp. NPDC051485]|uniref:TIGR03084 family metal-binding protein n=1 Tax=Dactylosporangium sp. NPDC051485 TaxID=3154846 RepID=UPI00342A9A52
MPEPTVYASLAADGEGVDALVAGLSPDGWSTPTPAVGWTVAHQIAHLAATFRLAGLAASRPEDFKTLMAGLTTNFNSNVDHALAEYLAEPPEVLLRRWRHERAWAQSALTAVAPDQPVPWLVRPIPAGVLAAAGMMELFAHGQDVADALGARRTHTDRLEHLVAFAVRTWDFGYQGRGLTPPDAEFRFEITLPSGRLWQYGPQDGQRITGPAVDFCLLVSRRRHRDDLAVKAEGADADAWLDLAQAYRGPAGTGRQPGQFAALQG